MSLCIPINIATAAMEDIYKRLCWLYITMKNTLVYDHIGNTYHLSDLIELSERFQIRSSLLIRLIVSRNHFFRTSE